MFYMTQDLVCCILSSGEFIVHYTVSLFRHEARGWIRPGDDET